MHAFEHPAGPVPSALELVTGLFFHHDSDISMPGKKLLGKDLKGI